MRTLWSVPAVLVALVGLTGCYDLSAPSGPQRDDFLQNRNGTPSQEQGQTHGDAPDAATATAIQNAATSDAVDAIDRDLEAAALADEYYARQFLLAADSAK